MAEPVFDVVVVGNAGVDTNVYPYGNEIDFSVEANQQPTIPIQHH